MFEHFTAQNKVEGRIVLSTNTGRIWADLLAVLYTVMQDAGAANTHRSAHVYD